MEAPAAHSWFLRKQEDGSIFGPLSFKQLARGASGAQAKIYKTHYTNPEVEQSD